MITLCLVAIIGGKSIGKPSVAKPLELPTLFGVCVYSFMCHHSLPSLVTPITKKNNIYRLLAGDFLLIFVFYNLLSLTGECARLILCLLQRCEIFPTSSNGSEFVIWIVSSNIISRSRCFHVWRSQRHIYAQLRTDGGWINRSCVRAPAVLSGPVPGRDVVHQLPHHSHHAAEQPQDSDSGRKPRLDSWKGMNSVIDDALVDFQRDARWNPKFNSLKPTILCISILYTSNSRLVYRFWRCSLRWLSHFLPRMLKFSSA